MAGAALAVAGAKAAMSLLFGVTPVDPATMATLDPTVALRDE